MKNYIMKNHRFFEFIILCVMFFSFEILMSIRYQIKIYAPYYILTLASIALIPGFLVLINQNKLRFIMYSVFLFIGLVIFVADSCLFYYKEDVFSWAMIQDVGDGLTMGIKYNVFIAFNIWQWALIFLFLAFCVWGLRTITLKNNVSVARLNWKRLLYLGLASLMLLSSGLYLKEVDVHLYQVPQDKRTYLLTFGFSTFNQNDAVHTLGTYLLKNRMKEEALSILDDVDSNEMALHSNKFGDLAGKNVIMIMTETVEQYAMDEVLTPTLYELYHSGYQFTNTYGAAKTNYTYDAEFKALTSMMYYNNDNLMHSYADNEFTNALPFLLREQGYTANAFHSFYRHYFNRDDMYEALGFENYYANEDMTFSEVDFWPLDSEFIGQTLDLVAPVQENPFFSFVITLSTHGAFRERRTEFETYYQAIEVDGRFADYDEEFINLLAAQMDLSIGLELLINDLTAKNLLEDTVIVLFSDHKNYSSPETTKKYTTLTHEYDVYNYEYDIIPFVIYNPSITNQEITDLTSQYDIMPTLCDLLGVEVVRDYVYGQSIFLYETDEYENRPIILGYNRWVSKGLIVYDKQIVMVDSSIVNPMDYLAVMQEDIYQTIERFHAYFMTDYFRKTAID